MRLPLFKNSNNSIINFIYLYIYKIKENELYLYNHQSIYLLFIKLYISFLILFSFSKYNKYKELSKFNINKQYIKTQKYINLTFHNYISDKIKINIAIYTHCIKNGGRARVTALFLKYLYKIRLFNMYLFTRRYKEDNEYFFPDNIKRIIIKNDLIKAIKKNRIDILIYELDEIKDILTLNNFSNIKVIFYHHSSTFDWLYENYTIFKSIYKTFFNSKYVVSIVPFENDYLFKKWGIRSILMNNFITYEFGSVIQTDLSSKIIIMIGRAIAKKKRFIIGIQSMEYIIKEIPDCELKIISNLTGINNLQDFVNNLNLEQNIKFIGYFAAPDIFFRNASLSFFPSITEAFPMVLVETKIYGIPNILLGLDYISISKGGTIIIFDDTPELLAKKSIILLNNKKYKKFLSIEARKSMKQFNNDILLIKWVKLILSIYNNDSYYIKLREEDKKINQNEAIKIINNQIKLLKMRDKNFYNINVKEYENFTSLEKINLK